MRERTWSQQPCAWALFCLLHTGCGESDLHSGSLLGWMYSLVPCAMSGTRSCAVLCCWEAGPATRGPRTGALTPVLGEQRGKGALLQHASGVVLLGELVDLPMIDAIVVPWLVLLVLQAMMQGHRHCCVGQQAHRSCWTTPCWQQWTVQRLLECCRALLACRRLETLSLKQNIPCPCAVAASAPLAAFAAPLHLLLLPCCRPSAAKRLLQVRR